MDSDDKVLLGFIIAGSILASIIMLTGYLLQKQKVDLEMKKIELQIVMYRNK